MSRICKKLQERNELLSHYTALEFFARQGDWQTKSYAHLVKELHAWELDPIYEDALRANLPRAHVRIGNSFEMAQDSKYQRRFNFFVLDNPQMIYGGYCEHFEALNLASVLMSTIGILIFNVNKKPFAYDHHPDWQNRRREYYGCDATNLTSHFLISFYAERIERLGFNMRFIFEEQRNSDYLSYIVAGVSRKNEV